MLSTISCSSCCTYVSPGLCSIENSYIAYTYRIAMLCPHSIDDNHWLLNTPCFLRLILCCDSRVAGLRFYLSKRLYFEKRGVKTFFLINKERLDPKQIWKTQLKEILQIRSAVLNVITGCRQSRFGNVHRSASVVLPSMFGKSLLV